MQVSNYSEFRKNLKAHLDKVTDNGEALIVHRQSGKTVVVIALEDYNAWQETEYLLANKANKKRLEASVSEMKNGHIVAEKLIEP